jgi:hypothetical protein
MQLAFLGCGILATLPAQAGLFDKLTCADKPLRLEWTESTDWAATFIKAFSNSGSLARDIKPADFAERKIVTSGIQINFATEPVDTPGRRVLDAL